MPYEETEAQIADNLPKITALGRIGVSVHSGGYNRIAMTRWLINLFLTGAEAGKFKVKVPEDLVSGESLLPGS